MGTRAGVALGVWVLVCGGIACNKAEDTGDTGDTDDTGSSDTIAPTVVAIDPEDGAEDVAADIQVVVTFSEALDPDSVGTSALSLKTGETAVQGAAVLDGDRLTFTPSAPLLSKTTYTVALSEDLTDLAGNALGVVSATSFTVAWDPGESNLVFFSYDTEDSEDGDVVLRRVDFEGATASAPTVLSDPEWHYCADIELLLFSPDGTRVAVVAGKQDSGSERELFVVPLEGDEPPTRVSHVMEETGEVTWFRWSPDGTQLAYVADDDGWVDASESAVYVVGADGSGGLRVSSVEHIAFEEFLLWSPDGSHVLYIDDKDDGDQRHLWAVPSEGGAAVDLSQREIDWDRDAGPRFSPDGSKLAFNDRFALYVTTLAGGTPTEVTDPENNFFWSFEWLDDTHLIWAGCVTCYSETLYRSEVGGGAPVPLLLNQGSMVSWAVSPDRQYVAYFRDSPLGIWVADAWADGATSETDYAVSEGEFDFQGGGDWERPVWSPDSAWILYRSQVTYDAPHQLRLVSRDASTRSTLSALQDEYQDAVPMNSYGFSPDGQWITFGVFDNDIDDGRGHIHRVRLDGTDAIVVNDNSVTDADAYQIRDGAGVSALRALYTLW